MHIFVRAASTAAIFAASTIPGGVAQAAEPCVSGAEVREQVHALVASLRDDVRAKTTRAQVRAALVETLTALRGATADTPEERRELGRQIAALARTLESAEGRVERKAIVLQILALTEERERGGLTADERTEMKAALDALKRAIVAKTDRGAEGRAVADAFEALHDQMNCVPA